MGADAHRHGPLERAVNSRGGGADARMFDIQQGGSTASVRHPHTPEGGEGGGGGVKTHQWMFR